MRRITTSAAAAQNANGIRSRVQPTKLKEPLSPYLKSPVPELGDNMPRLELLALVRGRDAAPGRATEETRSSRDDAEVRGGAPSAVQRPRAA